jgi:hypothetical protein
MSLDVNRASLEMRLTEWRGDFSSTRPLDSDVYSAEISPGERLVVTELRRSDANRNPAIVKVLPSRNVAFAFERHCFDCEHGRYSLRPVSH